MTFQDQVVFAVKESGFPLEYVISLDLSAFNSLYLSCYRSFAKQQVLKFISDRLAAHGDKDNTKDWLKQWEEWLPESSDGNDSEAFLKKIGKGF